MPLSRNRILTLVLAGLVATVGAQAQVSTGAGNVTEQARPALVGESGSRWAQAASQRVVRRYDPVILHLGRTVYADLQEAR
jgi:hypothetical protein